MANTELQIKKKKNSGNIAMGKVINLGGGRSLTPGDLKLIQSQYKLLQQKGKSTKWMEDLYPKNLLDPA